MTQLPPDIVALLAPLARVPGYSPQQLPTASSRLLLDARRALGDDDAFALWVGVLFAQIHQAPELALAAPRLAGVVEQASKLLKLHSEPAAARALQYHLPAWQRALAAGVAALPAPRLVLPPAVTEHVEPECAIKRLLNALYKLYLAVHWLLYRHLPDKGKAVANALADYLPVVLRHNGLPWNNNGDFVLSQASTPHRRLAALVAEALRGPYPGYGRYQVLSWAHAALHEEKPAGLKTFASAVARSAAHWSDAAFDQFLREVVLYETKWDSAQNELVYHRADVLKFRRQPDRRALPEALHALGRTTPEAAQLAAWLAEVQQTVAVAAPALPPAEAVDIPDMALRLAIIHALMYEQPRIRPAFDVREFARTYPLREIDVESEGYEIIPEALAYFAELPLTPELLACVRSLNFDFGKPPLKIIFQVLPFDDGEGEEFQLTSLSGLEHCRNLERFSLTELWPGYTPPSLAPLLQLPNLRKVYLDAALANTPEYQELARRGILQLG